MTAAEYFDFDKDRLGTAAEGRIRALTKAISSNSGAVNGAVQVEGYTDKFGTKEYNQELSERRAQKVANILNQRLTEKVTVSVTGHGEKYATQNDSPATDENIARLAKDRKVVITVPLKAIPAEWDGQTFGPDKPFIASMAGASSSAGNSVRAFNRRGDQMPNGGGQARESLSNIPNPVSKTIGKFGGQEIFVDYDATKNIWVATCPNREGERGRDIVMTSPHAAEITRDNFGDRFRKGGGNAAVSQLRENGMDPSEALKLVLRGRDAVMGYFNGGSPHRTMVSNFPPERRAEPASSSYPLVLCRLKGMDVTQRMKDGNYVAEWGPKDGPKVVIFESDRPLRVADFKENSEAWNNLKNAAKYNDFRPVQLRKAGASWI